MRSSPVNSFRHTGTRGMEFRHSDIEIRHGGMEFSAVHFGDSEALSAVTAALPDGRRWIISPNQTRISEDIVARYAGSLVDNARKLAATNAAGRFLAEILAYVRSLPDGRKSTFLSSTDRHLVSDAEADVADALAAALERDDPYRAAVEFETRVPYLVADRGLIDAMDAVHAAFARDYDEEEWLAAAAAGTEQLLTGTQPFISAQVAAWKSADAGSGAFSSRS